MLKKRGFSRIVQPQDQHVVLLAFRVLGIERRCQMKHRKWVQAGCRLPVFAKSPRTWLCRHTTGGIKEFLCDATTEKGKYFMMNNDRDN